MSVFSRIDLFISDCASAGLSTARIIDDVVREFEVSHEFAECVVASFFKEEYQCDTHDYAMNDYESKFEIEYDF